MFRRFSWWVLISLVLAGPAPASAADAVLVLSSGDPAYQAVAAGFKKAYPGKYREINLEGSDEKQRNTGEQLKAEHPVVAVVIGDLAAQMAKWYLEGVPVVYCSAVRAAKLSLTSSSASGIYHEPDPGEQLKILSASFPDKKRVGLIYSPEYANLNESDLKSRATQMGITLEVEAMKNIKQVPEKLQTLIPRVDLLWVFTDPVVLSQYSIQFIVLQSINAGKPIFCGDDGLAHGGATAALVPDLTDAGQKAAMEAERVLAGSTLEPGSVVYPRGRLVLNRKTAALLKVSFPGDLLKTAEEVIE